jgi:hypothetical protein
MRTAQDEYACTRCGYKTKIKARMRRHLYYLKSICPGSKNNIELTDVIKEIILENRVYILPTQAELTRQDRIEKEKKKIEKEKEKEKIEKEKEKIEKEKDNTIINILTTAKDKSGMIYLNYTRACQNADENVFKFGKTHDLDERDSNYVKGNEMQFAVKVTDRHKCERIVRAYFKIEFEARRDYGYEYFEGDILEMVLAIKKVLADFIIETVIEFKYLID